MKDSISYLAKDSLIQDSLRQYILSSDSVEGGMDSLSINLQSHTSREESSRHEGKSLPFNIEQVDSIFVLLLLCFLFFAHIYNGGISFIKENISLLFSPAKRIFKQTTAREVVYGYFLLFQTVVLISICVYDAFVEYDSSSGPNTPLITIISFIILIGIFLGIKDIIYKVIGYVFDQQRLINTWRRVSIVSVEILGILYFIPTLLLVYSNYYHSAILAFMLILFLIVQIILFYQIIIFFVNQKFNFLYLIAYLCTFEILPYIFLSIGLIYLYRTDVFNTLWL